MLVFTSLQVFQEKNDELVALKYMSVITCFTPYFLHCETSAFMHLQTYMYIVHQPLSTNNH